MAEDKTLAIVIGHRGRVNVGFIERTPDDVIMHRARNVIRWGTDAGLEQLANGGPRGETRLGEELMARKRIHRLAVVEEIECVPEAWKDTYGDE